MYRFLIFIPAILFCLNIQAQDFNTRNIETQVREVTVFLEGAQINRSHELQVEKGAHELKFTGLSPYVDANSIRVSADGDLTVLNVEHQINYLREKQQRELRPKLKEQIQNIDDSINILSVQNEIIESQLGLLHQNRKLPGSSTTRVAHLKEIAEFYKEELTSLKMRQLEIKVTQKSLKEKRERLRRQLGKRMDVNQPTSSEIIVNIDMKSEGKAQFELSYLVGEAGWYPTYDIRVQNIDQPLQLSYKANVRQRTGVDWEDVQLTFSSAQPSTNQQAPELRPYYLDYYGYDAQYSDFDRVRGKIIDAETGEPIIFASVNVAGTSIGTETDLDGKFSLMLPEGKTHLAVSYVGYQSKVVPVTSSNMIIELESGTTLDEVVVVDYHVPLIERDLGAVGAKTGGIRNKENNVRQDHPIPLQSEESLMNFEFTIDRPYTIPTGTNKRTLEMQRKQIPVDFHYYAVPKLDPNAYLMAEIVDWQDYQLIAGEAQLYFEGTYIGPSLIDPSEANDSLRFSMGPDKNITVEREQIRDFSDHRFFGSRTEVTKAYRLSVQNNKSDNITIILADQVPISKIEKVDVEVVETSGAIPHEETGKLEWTIELGPKDKAERTLRYQVTVPRGKGRIVE